MDENMRMQLEEIKKLKGEEKEKQLLLFAEEHNAAQAYNELGIYYREEKGDHKKGIEMFEKAVSIQEDASLYSNIGSAYFTLAQTDTPQRNFYMKKTVEAFEKSACLNSASYYFLGNLYMPKINAPFMDNYEKAISYFMKIEKEKTYFWGLAMKNIGLYYYHEKKDYVRASAYLKMAKEANPKDKKVANYYEYAFGKVRNRKFWKNEYENINDQNDVEKIVTEGLKKSVRRCPKCGSENCQRISAWTKINRQLFGGFGVKRYRQYMVKFQCNSCHHEW